MTSKRTVLCTVWALVAMLGGCTVAKRAVAEYDVNAIAGIAFAGAPAHIGLIETRQPQLSVRAFDEVFFDFDRSRIVRNNVALGFGVQHPGAVTAEIYHVWVGNREARDETYMLALLTLRI